MLHFILQLVGDKDTAEEVRQLDSSGYLGGNVKYLHNSKSAIILESLSPQKNMLARMHSKNVTLSCD